MVELGVRSEIERDVASRLEGAFVKRRISIGCNSATRSNAIQTLSKVFLARTRLYGYAPEARVSPVSGLQKCDTILLVRTWSYWYIVICMYMTVWPISTTYCIFLSEIILSLERSVCGLNALNALNASESV